MESKSKQNYLVTQHPKYELVTSHICRRSFATNGSLKGLSMGYLMEIIEFANLQKVSRI